MSAHRATLRARLRYTFDNIMSRGAIALIGWLALASLALVVTIAAIVLLLGIGPTRDDGTPLGFLDTLWYGLMRTLDAGTMGSDTGRWPFLLSMLTITLGGIFIVSTLIGVLTSGIDAKLTDLRKGRSFVVEAGHTVILGWSPQIFTIVAELALANANQRRPCVAILAEKDKVEMEDELRHRVGSTGKTRVVCRTGTPLEMSDLDIVNPDAARSIVIISPDGDDPDSQVIKTILALTNNPRRHSGQYHIVAEIRDPANREAAQLVGRGEAQFVLAGDLVARIAVQTSRQSGLADVYTELLSFAMDEIDFQEEPALVGHTFGEALLAFEDSAVIGLHTAGGVRLNPPMDTPIAPGDRIIAISEDDDTVRFSGLGPRPVDEPAIVDAPVRTPVPEHTLVLGWNGWTTAIVSHLDRYVAPGSIVTIGSRKLDAAETIAAECAGLQNLRVTCVACDTVSRKALEGLGVANYEHVIVLSSADTPNPQAADARTLITLLHLRDMAAQHGYRFSIVSEMRDVRNRALAEVDRADDFIVSDQLASLLLTQISENRDLAAVFDELFAPDGSEFYLKPAGDYVVTGRPVMFSTVVEAGRRRGEVAVGYRVRAQAGDATCHYGIVMNPDKSAQITFTPADCIIVLAEE
ncbi:MAG: potassium transporter TrkA [Chloroflexi bacterium]|nr:MAG: potassium transporter TrkA [Chloroflexota bacterium]